MQTPCCGAEKRILWFEHCDQLVVFGVASYVWPCVCVCVSFVSVDSFLGRQRAEKIKLQIRYVHMDCCRYGTRRLRATRETDKKEEKSASANPFGNTSSEVDEQKKKETKTNTPEVLEYEREISHG